MSDENTGAPTEDTDAEKKTRRTAIKRVFADAVEMVHDLFRLNTATMKKNVSWNEVPELVDVAHEHFFHTVDSSGRPQKYSAPVGGHFHELEVEKNKKGEVIAVSVKGPPLKFARRRVGKRMKKVVVEFNEADKHTHECTYERSSRLKKAQVNEEAVRHMSQVLNKQNSKKVEGGEDLQVTSDAL